MERVAEAEVIVSMESAHRYNKVRGRGLSRMEYRRLAKEVAGMGIPDGGMVFDIGTGPGCIALEPANLQGWEVRSDLLDLMVVKKAA